MAERRRIVDAHHHLWDLQACRYPWLMETGVKRFFGDPAPIQKNYLAADLIDDARRYELSASVHIQVGVAEGDEVKESEWIDEASGDSRIPAALVAFCDLSSDSAQRILEKQTGIKRVRGIRHIVGREINEDAKTGSDALLDNSIWIENLASLRERELSFDLQMIPQQAGRAASLLERIPGLRVALCHCGSPWDQSETGLQLWRAGLQRFAENPDVFCKLSGLAMFDHNYNLDAARAVIDTCIELFGPERCMFGSNFPVDKLHKTYDEVWGTFEEVASGYSSDEQALLFAGTAESFYRLG